MYGKALLSINGAGIRAYIFSRHLILFSRVQYLKLTLQSTTRIHLYQNFNKWHRHRGSHPFTAFNTVFCVHNISRWQYYHLQEYTCIKI